MIHFLENTLIQDRHPISIALIGAGGTGSQLLPHLARIHTTLVALGKQGLDVTVYDDDEVSHANLARQLFSEQDVGANKAIVQVSRLNRFYGLNWQAVPFQFNAETLDMFNQPSYNFYLTCVDSVKARKQIFACFQKQFPKLSISESHQIPYYWIDCGNMKDYGQVVMATLQKIKQPKSKYPTAEEMPNVFDLFPDMSDEDGADLPSCSLADAIEKQDLFINTEIASKAGRLLWAFLKESYIDSQGSYCNLSSGKTMPIPIKAKPKNKQLAAL